MILIENNFNRIPKVLNLKKKCLKVENVCEVLNSFGNLEKLKHGEMSSSEFKLVINNS